MKISVDDDKRIEEIQREFNTNFPYLKLEFYSIANKSAWVYIKSSKKISACRTIKNNETLTITPEMTVFELEEKIHSIYGLGILVFRQSGKVWLETTLTEAWSLNEQNKQGELLSKLVF